LKQLPLRCLLDVKPESGNQAQDREYAARGAYENIGHDCALIAE
jgi:hypothetical protein